MGPKKPKRGLGKGLEALIPKSSFLEEDRLSDKEQNQRVMDIQKIRPNPHQPRKKFSKESIEELKLSIAKHGVLQPILITKDDKKEDTYVIIAGERRWRACMELKFNEIPVVVKDYTDQELMEVALVENLQREDLHVVEEGKAYQYLMERYKLSPAELGETLGKSRSHIANTIRLLSLSEVVLALLEENKLSAGHGRALLSLNDPRKQEAWAYKIIDEGLTVRDIEKALKDSQNKGKRSKRRPRQDPELEAIQEQLKSFFGTKVTIHQGKKKGKLEIEYYRPEDLERILSLLSLED